MNDAIEVQVKPVIVGDFEEAIREIVRDELNKHPNDV